MSEREHILCVDDEVGVLEGLDLILGRRFRVETATSGEAALDVLERYRDIAVVVSDMQMPQMDGATFLSMARAVAPDAVRILLTGQADMKTAIAAVNDGQIFRFLTKPCTPATMIAAIDAACAQRRLITAERVLLERTLPGSIQALIDALADDPIAFRSSARISKLTRALLGVLDLESCWQIEVAAMLWPVGDRGISQLPRLEQVREILTAVARPPGTSPTDELVHRGAMILRLAIELDALEGQGMPTEHAIAMLRGRDMFDHDVLVAAGSLPVPGVVVPGRA
jgi:CheY-like chemotaxis protein